MADGALDPKWEQLVAAHYVGAWGRSGKPQPFAAGRALQLPPDFTVLAFPPSNLRPYWTYATCGMSQAGDPAPLELFMFAPYASPDLVELLYATAHYHRIGGPLGLDQTINFGRPWMGQSACTYGLVSLPYLDGPKLENASIRGQTVKVLWLLPITPAERAFMVERGATALEAEFEKSGLQFVRPGRPSVV
jgi:hypothetical protein